MILCLSDLWPPFPGGAERLMFNLARDLQHRGHPVHTLTGYEHAEQFDGPPVTTLPIDTREGAAGARMVLDVIDQLGAKLILTHHHYAFRFEAELVATGLPLVQVVLNGHRIPEAAMAVYISQWVRREVGGNQPGDMVITPPALPDVVADRHGSAIGFIKPIEHKGVDLLYQIAAAEPDRRFVVLRGEWQVLEDIRPAPNITFMEPVKDIRDFWCEVRMVLVPSRSEDAGTVAQEAAMNGVPCLSSNVGGLVETNRGGVQLYPDDLRRWLRAIRLLDNPAEYDRLVARQRQHLRRANHPRLLDQFAARIEALWTRS